MKRGFLFTIRVLFIIYVATVCCLCFLNLSFTQELNLPSYLWGYRMDRVVHFLMFVPFPVLAIPVFNLSRKSTGLRILRCLVIFLAGILFAAATELIQYYFLALREGDFIDFKADLLGLGAGLVIFFIFCPPIIRWMRDPSLY